MRLLVYWGNKLTVGNFKAQKTDKEESGDVGEAVASQVQVLFDAHDGGVLRNHVSTIATMVFFLR